MAKKEKTGIAIDVSKEDNLLLKQYILNLENIGIYKTKSQAASKLFTVGLYNEIKNFSDDNDNK